MSKAETTRTQQRAAAFRKALIARRPEHATECRHGECFCPFPDFRAAIDEAWQKVPERRHAPAS